MGILRDTQERQQARFEELIKDILENIPRADGLEVPDLVKQVQIELKRRDKEGIREKTLTRVICRITGRKLLEDLKSREPIVLSEFDPEEESAKVLQDRRSAAMAKTSYNPENGKWTLKSPLAVKWFVMVQYQRFYRDFEQETARLTSLIENPNERLIRSYLSSLPRYSYAVYDRLRSGKPMGYQLFPGDRRFRDLSKETPRY